MKVSVILPTYNESGNIVPLISEIQKSIPPNWDHEVIVVDDNSPDGTFEITRNAFHQDPRIKPILRLSDRGFAKSIRTGIENAHGDQIIVMDTDFTHAPSDIPKLLHVSQVFDIVSGSRFCSGGRMQDVQHYLASMAYNWFIRLLLRTQIQDNLGGFFTINRKKLLDLPCDKIFFGYGDYFFRFLFFARKAGLSFVEIPSIYAVRSTGKSKSDFFKMLFSYTIAVLKLKFKNSFLFDSKK